jgi:hypothetical protein
MWAMNLLNTKIIEDALAALGETDYRMKEAGESTIMLSRSRKRPLDGNVLACGLIEFEANLGPDDKVESISKWAIDSFFIMFKENNIVNVDDGNGAININLAEPDSLQQLAQAIKSGLKTIDAFYEHERESRTDGSDQ